MPFHPKLFRSLFSSHSFFHKAKNLQRSIYEIVARERDNMECVKLLRSCEQQQPITNRKFLSRLYIPVHPQTNKRFVGAMQSFGHSIKNVNVKFDPTSIGVAATKYPAAECIFFGFYLRWLGEDYRRIRKNQSGMTSPRFCASWKELTS